MLRTTGRQNYSCAINRDSGLPRCENRLYAACAQMGYAENCCRHTSCTISLSHSIHSKTQ